MTASALIRGFKSKTTIGQRELCESCLDLLNEAMASKGVEQMVEQMLKTYPLGISSGLFHALIRLAYAVEGYRVEPASLNEVARDWPAA